MAFPMGTNKENERDALMSDRLVPSRDTCGSVAHLRLQRDENWAPTNDFQEVLSQNVLGRELTNVRVLSYKNKPARQDPGQSELKVLFSHNRDGGARPRANRSVPHQAMKVLDAPGLLDDFYSHPVDWSQSNVVAVALAETVFLFNAGSGRAEKLLSLPGGALVTSVRWHGKGGHLGVGTSHGEVQIWDGGEGQRQLRSLKGRSGRVGAVAWYEHVLSCGAADSEVHHHDVRQREHFVGRLEGHGDLVCGLEYNADGVLASGSNDNTVCIWDRCNFSTALHSFGHQAAVKALKWCPWNRHTLASGGGSADRQVCLWNASSGRMLQAADAESQVTAIAWGSHEKELVTAHGYSRNQLSLWRYPTLQKSTDLEGHGARLLDLTQSPDGSLVCSASADETLRFWRVFTPVSAEKSRTERQPEPNAILKTIR